MTRTAAPSEPALPVATRPPKAPRICTAAVLEAGARLVLPAAESRHVKVLRLAAGDAVVLFDGGSDREWPAEVLSVGAGVEVKLGDALDARRELDVAVTLAVGMPANERMDALVEKATELGAAAIVPLMTARSVLRLEGARAEARRGRWQAIAVSACEQCGRNRLPVVHAPMALRAFLAGAAALPRARVVLGFAADAWPLAEVAALAPAVSGEAADGVVVLSGPEGGLDDAEERSAVDAGFVVASLGPRVLRADTAPLAALMTIAGRSAAQPPSAGPATRSRGQDV